MKSAFLIAALLTTVLASPPAYPFTTGGFSHPYGVTVDARTNFIFVSSVNGPLDAKDDNGYISRLKGDGSIDNLRFIDGASKSVKLNAPKGMTVVGTTLYVCDIDKLRAFDATYGNHLFDVNFGNLPVQHFYDVKQGHDGALYVADGPGNRIYRVDIPKQHEVTTFVSGESLGQPHGLVWFTAKQAYVVAGWSSGQVTAYSRTGRTRPLPAIFLRTLEGMDADDKGNLYVSSLGLGGIYKIDKDFSLNSFNTGIDSPSGVAFHKAGNQIITASFDAGTVESFPITLEAQVSPIKIMETIRQAPAEAEPPAEEVKQEGEKVSQEKASEEKKEEEPKEEKAEPKKEEKPAEKPEWTPEMGNY